jgi:hypothetical protein
MPEEPVKQSCEAGLKITTVYLVHPVKLSELGGLGRRAVLKAGTAADARLSFHPYGHGIVYETERIRKCVPWANISDWDEMP